MAVVGCTEQWTDIEQAMDTQRRNSGVVAEEIERNQRKEEENEAGREHTRRRSHGRREGTEQRMERNEKGRRRQICKKNYRRKQEVADEERRERKAIREVGKESRKKEDEEKVKS